MRKLRLREVKYLALGLRGTNGELEPKVRTAAHPIPALLVLLYKFDVQDGGEEMDRSNWCQYREWKEMLDGDQSWERFKPQT